MRETEAEAVVIGGGVVGASAAYHLAKARRRVMVVDRGPILSGCSSATHAGLNVSAKEGDSYIQFTLDAVRRYATLESELGCDLEYRGRGSIAMVVENESDWEPVLRYVEDVNRVPGVGLQIHRTEEARRLVPALPSWIQGAVFCPVDGDINPFLLVSAYIRKAKEYGAVIKTGMEVQDVEVSCGHVAAVRTPTLTVHTPCVVNAAGIDSPRIARMVGFTMPIVPAHGQVVTTVPARPFLTYNLRGLTQTASGNVLVGTTKNFIGSAKDTHLDLAPGGILTAMRLFPFLKDLQVARIWAGVRPWPIDGLPILGRVPEVKGFFVAAGHSGITLGDMIGKVMSDLVIEGHTSENIHPYRPDRFNGDALSFVMKMFRKYEANDARAEADSNRRQLTPRQGN